MKNALLLGAFILLSSASSYVQSEECNDEIQQVQVSAVYPTADTLPENLLRFYLYFNQPMKTGDTLSYVYLTDDSGKRLDGVFLENKFSLWSPDRTRLTLLFDPGRVKTGLVAHNTFGRALQAGSTYNLVVDASAMNQLGCSSIYTKRFVVEAPNYEKPSILKWQFNEPKSGTKQPLTIDFNAPIDHTSLAFRIRVKSRDNKVVSGSINIGSQDKQWIFTPELKWNSDELYRVSIDPILEDIAGNRITGLFDQPSLIEDSVNKGKVFEVAIALSQ